MPTIIVAGRGVADGLIEVKDRRSGERSDIAIDEVVDHVAGLIRAS